MPVQVVQTDFGAEGHPRLQRTPDETRQVTLKEPSPPFIPHYPLQTVLDTLILGLQHVVLDHGGRALQPQLEHLNGVKEDGYAHRNHTS